MAHPNIWERRAAVARALADQGQLSRAERKALAVQFGCNIAAIHGDVEALTVTPVGGIYLIRNVSTGWRYVGMTRNLTRRWRSHRYTLAAERHANKRLQADWNTMGADAFAFEVLEEVPASDFTLSDRERHWITRLRPEYNVA